MPKTQALPGVCQAVWHRQEPVSSPAFHLSMVLAAVTVHSPRRRLVASVETVPTAAQIRFEHLGHDQIKCGVSARRAPTLQGRLGLAARLLPWKPRPLPHSPLHPFQGTASILGRGAPAWSGGAPGASAGFSPPHAPSPRPLGPPTGSFD